MNKCKKCITVELNDFEEIKHGLCWSCMSNDVDIIDNNPNIAEIKNDEILNNSLENILMKSDKHPLSGVLEGDGNEEDLSTKGGKKNKAEENNEPSTSKNESKPKKIIEDEEGLKVVRESKEILTKSDRAKTRAYALINKALKETGQFELSVTLNDTVETVSSVPYKEKNIEDVVMTTTMEVIDSDISKKKK